MKLVNPQLAHDISCNDKFLITIFAINGFGQLTWPGSTCFSLLLLFRFGFEAFLIDSVAKMSFCYDFTFLQILEVANLH